MGIKSWNVIGTVGSHVILVRPSAQQKETRGYDTAARSPCADRGLKLMLSSSKAGRMLSLLSEAKDLVVVNKHIIEDGLSLTRFFLSLSMPVLGRIVGVVSGEHHVWSAC